MKIFSWFRESNQLYFPGSLIYFKFKGYFELYKQIFSKLRIDFKLLDKQVCCGLIAFEAGYEGEARRLTRKNFELFKEIKINKIITSEPSCYKMFLKQYPEFLPDWDIKVENLWELILNKLINKPRLIKYKALEIVGFHDNCYLGRYCNVYKEPRKILELIGYEVLEFSNSKKDSFCCGSCGGLMNVNPELADKIARQRLLQAKRKGIQKLIVIGFENYSLLKKNSKELGIEIIEFSEVLGNALGLLIKDEKEEYLDDEEKIFIDKD